MDVNFFGAVRLSNIVVSQMIKENQKKVNPQNQYSIVNVGSVQSLLAIPYRSACKKSLTFFYFIAFNLSLILFRRCFKVCFACLRRFFASWATSTSEHWGYQHVSRLHQHEYFIERHQRYGRNEQYQWRWPHECVQPELCGSSYNRFYNRPKEGSLHFNGFPPIWHMG